MLKSIKRAVVALGLLTAAHTVSANPSETTYATVKGWTIVSAHDLSSNEFLGCAMGRINNGDGLVLVMNDYGGWVLKFPHGAPQGSIVPVTMDLDRYSDQINMTGDGGWIAGDVHPDWVQALAAGSSLSVRYANRSLAIGLTGSAAAIKKVEECNSYGGRAPTTTAQAATPQVVESEHLRMGAGCPALGSQPSPTSGTPTTIIFNNQAGRAVTVYWLDYNGQPVEMLPLSNGGQGNLSTYVGHRFIAKDFDMTCHGGVIEVPSGYDTYTIN